MPGMWEDRIPVFGPGVLGFEAVHMIHLRTRRFLLLDKGTTGQIWNPATGLFQAVANVPPKLFCAGHSALSDGRILFAGGNFDVPIPSGNGSPAQKTAFIFDPGDPDAIPPTAPSWTQIADMEFRRYYPTCTTLHDGRVLVCTGFQNNDTGTQALKAEVYNPFVDGHPWTTVDLEFQQQLYPFTFLLPVVQATARGTFAAGPYIDAGSRSRILTTQKPLMTEWTWEDYPLNQSTNDAGLLHGSAAMYRPGKVLKAGGSPTGEGEAVTNASRIEHDLLGTWTASGNMTWKRRNHNLTVLPDGTVLCTGGNRIDNFGNASDPVFAAELWDPANPEAWQLLPEMDDPRWYHSTAALLADARVITTGGELDPPGYPAFSAQVFKPPYLDGNPQRAAFATPQPPGFMAHSQQYDIGFTHPDGLGIAQANLIRLASVTHGFDQDQRFIPLALTQVSPGVIRVTAPPRHTAPPGYYMLFLIDTQGVPCALAAYVRVGWA